MLFFYHNGNSSNGHYLQAEQNSLEDFENKQPFCFFQTCVLSDVMIHRSTSLCQNEHLHTRLWCDLMLQLLDLHVTGKFTRCLIISIAMCHPHFLEKWKLPSLLISVLAVEFYIINAFSSNLRKDRRQVLIWLEESEIFSSIWHEVFFNSSIVSKYIRLNSPDI